jgi:hypothetical protein
MINFYFYILVIICGFVFSWGLMRSERVYQYPFFMSAIFISFILPQAYSLKNDMDHTPESALAKVFIMSCLCAAMCWIGYQISPDRKWLNILNIEIDDRKLFKVGIFLMICGYIFSFFLNTGEAQTADNGNWTGLYTIYYFVFKVIYIALAIFLTQAIDKPSFNNLSCVILAFIPAFIPVLLLGRRQLTIVILIIFGLSFWFVKKYIPPRAIFVLLVLLGVYAIPLIGDIRGEIWRLVLSNDLSSLYLASQESFQELIEGNVLELRNAAMVIEASTLLNRYGYGTGFWDALVFQYFPGQFFGYELKESLMLHWGLNNVTSVFGYKISNGSTLTGIGDTFVEFNYLGCMIFGAIGYIFKTLWISANYYKSKVSILLYIGLISPALVAVSHGVGRFIQEALFQLLVAGFIVYFARSKTRVTY